MGSSESGDTIDLLLSLSLQVQVVELIRRLVQVDFCRSVEHSKVARWFPVPRKQRNKQKAVQGG